MTQTTSGIEPVFLPVYKRRRKVNPNDADVHVDYVDETGDAFEEYIVYHQKFVTWMKVNGKDADKKITPDQTAYGFQPLCLPRFSRFSLHLAVPLIVPLSSVR